MILLTVQNEHFVGFRPWKVFVCIPKHAILNVCITYTTSTSRLTRKKPLKV